MPAPQDPDLLPARISEVVKRSPRVFGLRIKAPASFTWTAGQHVALCAAPKGAPLGYYSIASAPDASDPGSFDLAAVSDALPEGVLAEAGASVWVSAASGGPIMDHLERTRAVVLIGMGTGVAPLRAILQVLSKQSRVETIVLLQGARAPDDLLFYDEFSVLERPGYSYFPVLSRPYDNWAGLRGYVQDHLDSRPAGTQYCICGSLEMVRQVGSLLLARGALESQIYAEGY